MGIMDRYLSMVKVQLSGATAGTTKWGWLESAGEFLQYGIIIALCFAQGWYIPAILLIAIVVVMAVVVMKD